MKKSWLAGLMTHQYKKLSVTTKMWMQFNVMPWTSLGVDAVLSSENIQNALKSLARWGSLRRSPDLLVGWGGALPDLTPSATATPRYSCLYGASFSFSVKMCSRICWSLSARPAFENPTFIGCNNYCGITWPKLISLAPYIFIGNERSVGIKCDGTARIL